MFAYYFVYSDVFKIFHGMEYLSYAQKDKDNLYNYICKI